MVNRLSELGYRECQTLLGLSVIGRVAVATPNGPHIVPVNYWIVDDDVVMRTTPYSVLGRYGHDAILAFEVDGFDTATASGWSVVARGRAAVVTEADELSELRRRITAEPWAPGPRSMYLRMECAELSGRSLLSAESAGENRP